MMRALASGFRVQGLGFRFHIMKRGWQRLGGSLDDEGLGFRVKGLGFRL